MIEQAARDFQAARVRDLESMFRRALEGASTTADLMALGEAVERCVEEVRARLPVTSRPA